MKQLIYITLLFVIIAIPSKNYGQEQLDIGQYTIYKPLVNNAASGEFDAFTASLFARKQWIGFPGSPSQISFNTVLPFAKNSIGLNYGEYSIGVHKEQKIFGDFTHTVNISRDQKLYFGLSGGAIIYQSNYNEVETSNANDTEFSSIDRYTYPDAKVGVYYTNKNFYSGLSVPSILNTENESFEFEFDDLYYYLISGFNLPLNRSFNLDISTFLKISQNNPIDFDINSQLNYEDKIGIGASYRYEKEMLLMVNFNLTETLKLGYCYHGYFQISGANFSGHELMLIFRLQKKEPVKIQTPRI